MTIAEDEATCVRRVACSFQTPAQALQQSLLALDLVMRVQAGSQCCCFTSVTSSVSSSNSSKVSTWLTTASQSKQEHTHAMSPQLSDLNQEPEEDT